MGTVAAIVDAIHRETASFPGTIGVAAKNLDSGEHIRISADTVFASASTIKVPILLDLFCRADAGTLDLAERLTVGENARSPGSGVLRHLSAGVELSLMDLAALMIVVSDNTATNLLIDRLTVPGVNETLRALGFHQTRLGGRVEFAALLKDIRSLGTTTPSDLAGMMEGLATGTLLRPASRAAALGILAQQHDRDLLPRYLPLSAYAHELGMPDNGLRVANKTGAWIGLRADAALVEWPGGRYVVSVIADGIPDRRFWPENEGDRLIALVSRLIFEHWCPGLAATT